MSLPDNVLQDLNAILTFQDGTTELQQCIRNLTIPVDTVSQAISVLPNVFSVTTTFNGVTSLPMILGEILFTDTTGT